MINRLIYLVMHVAAVAFLLLKFLITSREAQSGAPVALTIVDVLQVVLMLAIAFFAGRKLVQDGIKRTGYARDAPTVKRDSPSIDGYAHRLSAVVSLARSRHPLRLALTLVLLLVAAFALPMVLLMMAKGRSVEALEPFDWMLIAIVGVGTIFSFVLTARSKRS